METAQTPTPGLHCRSILIIEDDADVRESLQQVLEIEGYTIRTAENGRQAFARLAEMERPCLILLDLMMPVMNGWEFLAAYRENVVLATIPVVIVSAVGERPSAGAAHGFIKKPVELEALLAIVRRYCG